MGGGIVDLGTPRPGGGSTEGAGLTKLGRGLGGGFLPCLGVFTTLGRGFSLFGGFFTTLGFFPRLFLGGGVRMHPPYLTPSLGSNTDSLPEDTKKVKKITAKTDEMYCSSPGA